MKNAISILAHFDDLTIFGGGFLDEIDYGLIAASPARVDHLQVMADMGPPQYSIWGAIPEHEWTGYFLTPDRVEEYNRMSIARKILELMPDLERMGVETIYTHAPWGEYGHVHHQWVSDAVCRAAVRHGMTVWSPASVVYIPPDRQRWHVNMCNLTYRQTQYPRSRFEGRMDTYLRIEDSLPSRLWTWSDDFPPPQNQVLIRLVDRGGDQRNELVERQIERIADYGV